MKVLAVNPKKPKVFSPITITVTVTLENQKEVDELRDILSDNDKNGNPITTDYDGDYEWELPGQIAVAVAKEL